MSSPIIPKFKSFGGHVTWFPGHMASATKQLKESLNFVETVIEVRDARIPISSGNPILEELIENKNRIILLNKADLIDPPSKKKFTQYFRERDYQIFWSQRRDKTTILNIVPQLTKFITPSSRIKCQNAFVVGIPNTGKSTVINILKVAIRKGKNVAKTGPLPGVTRSISCFKVSENPPYYILDSPGVMIPSIKDYEVGLKLALTGAIKDSIVEGDILSEYLFSQLKKKNKLEYVTALGLPGPCSAATEVLEFISKKQGKNIHNATHHFISLYREGRLGLFTLDDIVS